MDLSVTRVVSRGDELVVDAARASFDRQAKHYSDAENINLLEFLAEHDPPHWVPFAHVRVTMLLNYWSPSTSLRDDTMVAGMAVHCTPDGWEVTHSIWGWARMVARGQMLHEDEAHAVKRALNELPGLQETLKVLGLQDEGDRLKDQPTARWSADDITLRVQCPIVIARQFFKHTVGFVYSEASGRYISYTGQHWPERWASAPDNKKQGAGEAVGFIRSALATAATGVAYAVSNVAYAFMRKVLRIAPEQARYCMPMATSTTFVVTGSKKAWHRLLSHRLDSAAQFEFRVLALMINSELLNEIPERRIKYDSH